MADNDYLPYKAINVFINRDYLEDVLKQVLERKGELPKEDLVAFNNQFKHYVTILGFRNPARAPLPLQVKAYATAFEEKDEVIPFTLSTWVELNENLAQMVISWLESQNWDRLMVRRDYKENEGFLNNWPASLTFDQLDEDFRKANPNADYEKDDLILMTIWISGRLPEEESDI